MIQNHFLESPRPIGFEERLSATIEMDSQHTSRRTINEVQDAPTIDAESLT